MPEPDPRNRVKLVIEDKLIPMPQDPPITFNGMTVIAACVYKDYGTGQLDDEPLEEMEKRAKTIDQIRDDIRNADVSDRGA